MKPDEKPALPSRDLNVPNLQLPFPRAVLPQRLRRKSFPILTSFATKSAFGPATC